MNSNILQNKEHFINKRQYQASLSSCSLFVQSVPLQPEQRGVQRSPAFLHLQLRLHPCLHPQLINFSTFCGAAGLSFTTGTRFSLIAFLIYLETLNTNIRDSKDIMHPIYFFNGSHSENTLNDL